MLTASHVAMKVCDGTMTSSRAYAPGAQGQRQSVQAIANANAVLDPAIRREFRLELFKLAAHDDVAACQHTGKSVFQLVCDCCVSGVDVKEGDHFSRLCSTVLRKS